MKVRIVNAARLPKWPRWAVALMVGWLGLVAYTTWSSARSGTDMNLCMLKSATGRPCPTCGTTRGVLAILAGRIWEGFTFNPLVFTVGLLGGAYLIARLILAKAVKLALTRAERRIAWVLGIALVLANWAYVIAYVG